MKNLSVLILIIVVCFLSGCTLDKPPIKMDTSIVISYKNQKGDDLLNSSTDNYFSPDNIKMFWMMEGKSSSFFGFQVYKPSDSNIYYLGFNVSNGSDTLLLQLNSNITDTVTSVTDNFITKKVWYNGALVWKSGDGLRKFTILK